jgi:hypothetical protein
MSSIVLTTGSPVPSMSDLVRMLHILAGEGTLDVIAERFTEPSSLLSRSRPYCNGWCLARELTDCESVAIIYAEANFSIIHGYYLALCDISTL